MGVGVTLIIVLAIVVAIWIFIEVKRMRHKVFAFFVIGLILFSYISATAVFSGKEIDLGSVEGLVQATGIYFSWLAHVGANIGVATASVIRMDWTTTTDKPTNITKIK